MATSEKLRIFSAYALPKIKLWSADRATALRKATFPAIGGPVYLAVCLGLVAGCTSDTSRERAVLPESESVEAAPWPRLIDVPEPAREGSAQSPTALIIEGRGLQTELSGSADELRRRKAALDAAPADTSTSSQANRVDALRARLRNLRRDVTE